MLASKLPNSRDAFSQIGLFIFKLDKQVNQRLVVLGQFRNSFVQNYRQEMLQFDDFLIYQPTEIRNQMVY